jgi:hypothetical protein
MSEPLFSSLVAAAIAAAVFIAAPVRADEPSFTVIGQPPCLPAEAAERFLNTNYEEFLARSVPGSDGRITELWVNQDTGRYTVVVNLGDQRCAVAFGQHDRYITEAL